MAKSALSGQVEILTDTIESEFGRLEGQIEAANARLNSICSDAEYESHRVAAIAKKVAALEKHTGFTPKHARDAECEPEVKQEDTPPADTPPTGLIKVKEGQRFVTEDGGIYMVCKRADNDKLDFAFCGLLGSKKAA